jgi:hypothetical protein
MPPAKDPENAAYSPRTLEHLFLSLSFETKKAPQDPEDLRSSRVTRRRCTDDASCPSILMYLPIIDNTYLV